MRKIINKVENFVDDTMEGIILAYGDKVKLLDGGTRVLLSNYPAKDGKVGIVTAGGSGHLPVFLGYVGQGLLDGCAVGNVFASPSAQKMADMIKACDRGNGVLCLYGNYGGDKLNFDMACETVDFEDDIATRTVLVRDDVASSPKGSEDKRRGVAGMVFAYKVAGAAAENMKSLDEVAAIAEKALANIRTMGVALSPCIVPDVGKPTFSIADDEIEIGMGIHGEPGIEKTEVLTAADLAQILLEKIFNDYDYSNSEVAVLVNGLGATPLMELYILFNEVARILQSKKVTIYKAMVGNYMTSLEMAGCSVTLMKLDNELKELLSAPSNTAALKMY